jgi:hypothetical protein
MKRYFCFIASVLLLAVAMPGCEKDENRVIFDGGTPPIISASYTGPVTLTIPDRNKEAFTLRWTNPEYTFNTGPSSQNVSYTIQVDTTGANFTNPSKQEISVSSDLSRTFTVDEFNKVMTRMGLVPEIPHNIEIRVISTINGAVPLTSNVVKFTGVIPFEDFAIPPPATRQLFITGDATQSSWTNSPPQNQKAVTVSKGEYFIIMDFVPGKFYKFLSNPGQWQPQYGGKSATGGDIGFNLGASSDPDAIPTPSEAGRYKVTLNFTTGKYTVVKQ